MKEDRIPLVLGLDMEEAKRRLLHVGAVLIVVPCASRKGVPDADSTRVIRQRAYDDPEKGTIIELVVSDFKTRCAWMEENCIETLGE